MLTFIWPSVVGGHYFAKLLFGACLLVIRRMGQIKYIPKWRRILFVFVA